MTTGFPVVIAVVGTEIVVGVVGPLACNTRVPIDDLVTDEC